MPQLWSLYLYQRNRAGASLDQLQKEFDIPAEEIEARLEAARLCFEKQCVIAGRLFAPSGRPRVQTAGRG